jgi:hypothetical protein
LPFESEAQAAEALAAANNGEQAEAPDTQDVQVEQGATTEDSFTSIDPSALPAELQNSYKQMQADYTRKTQSVAELRKQYEGIDAEAAREALALRDQLQNPDVQRQLYEHLASQFANADEPQEFMQEGDEDGFNDPRDTQLQQLSQRLEQFETRQIQAEVEQDLSRKEAMLREQNPTWSDEDMQTVAQFALSHGGDLLQGAEAYKALQSRLLKAHMDSKASVPGGAGSVSATGHAEVPQKFDSLDDAHKAAMVAWRAANSL